MFRGYRRFVSLAVSVCCILSMLFLDTLGVNALVNNSFSFSTRFYPNVISNNVYGSISGGGGYLSNGSGNISYNTGSINTNTHNAYSYHVSIPFFYRCSWVDVNGDASYVNNINRYFTFYFNNVTISNTSGTVTNKKIYLDEDNYLIWDSVYSKYFYIFGGKLQGLANDVAIPLRLEYDVAFEKQDSLGVNNDPIDYFDSNMTVAIQLYGRPSNANEIESNKLQVNDSNTQSKLNDLNNSTDNIEQSVTSETGTGLLATIKSFFGSFFDNVINSFKSLFIPENGYFTEWFNRLNTLLADKLGMLYAPFDLVISTLTAIMNADSSETGIPFPGIQWEDTWLVEPFTFTFSSLGDDMSDLRDTVYFATDVVLLFAFLYLLEEKIRHILED